jgi:hypothetical protein
MENITITIEAFGVKEINTDLTAETCALWMQSREIDLTDPGAALKKAAAEIIRPIIKEAMTQKRQVVLAGLAQEEGALMAPFAEPAPEE